MALSEGGRQLVDHNVQRNLLAARISEAYDLNKSARHHARLAWHLNGGGEELMRLADDLDALLRDVATLNVALCDKAMAILRALES